MEFLQGLPPLWGWALFLSVQTMYRRLASFCTFVCDEGKTARFEVARLIQAKVPFLDKIEHKFKWCGSIAPKIFINGSIASDNDCVSGLSGSYDTVVLKSNH